MLSKAGVEARPRQRDRGGTALHPRPRGCDAFVGGPLNAVVLCPVSSAEERRNTQLQRLLSDGGGAWMMGRAEGMLYLAWHPSPWSVMLTPRIGCAAACGSSA